MTKTLISQRKQIDFKAYIAFILHLFCVIIVLFLSSCSDKENYLYASLGDDSHKTKFKLEIAQTLDEKQRGLMFRNYLGENEGIIFIYHPPEKTGIWMKNTYIPLDILFISCDNKIEKIVPNMRPESLDVVYSDTAVCYVIELAGGVTGKIGLKKGDIFERD